MVRVGTWASACIVVGLGAPLLGSGFLNGDIAAYCAQGWTADLADRTVHLGYTALATLLAPLAGHTLPIWLDLVNLVAAVVLITAATRLHQGDRRTLGLAAAAVVLPWAPFAEVDVPWMALVMASAAGVPGCAALAVAVSPTALLALPWVASERRALAPLAEGVMAVGLLTVISGGSWWTGPRGVLEPRSFLIGRNFGTWVATIPWLVVLTGRWHRVGRPLLFALPLLFAPADVPAGVLVAIATTTTALIEPSLTPLGRVARVGAVSWLLVWAFFETQTRAERIRTEQAQIMAVLRAFEPGDGLVAPFTWGARAAVLATGDPYGLPWHPEGRFLRDQATPWALVDGTIWVLPPPRRATATEPRRSPRP
ncbi:MAG: hypothetical protein AAGA48_14000 [Myxococcota bacterium]